MFAFKIALKSVHFMSSSLGGSSCASSFKAFSEVTSSEVASFEPPTSGSSSESSVSRLFPLLSRWDDKGSGRRGRCPRADLYATSASSHRPALKWTFPSCFRSFAASRTTYKHVNMIFACAGGLLYVQIMGISRHSGMLQYAAGPSAFLGFRD